jgi:hypothetical protein
VSKKRGRAVLFAASVLVTATSARAEDAGEKLDSERYELAGFPIIGGNSDIGVQFGGAATLTKFHEIVAPYLWNADLVLSASVKSDSNGTRLVQQSHVFKIDAPWLAGGRVRLDARASFQRTINAGYFGIGNATQATLPPGATELGRRFQFLQQEARLRGISRIRTGTIVDIALSGELVYDSTEVYPGSKLEDDRHTLDHGRPVAVGTIPAAEGTVQTGIIIDRRDSEFVTRRGFYYQLGFGPTVGMAEGVAYGQGGAVLSHYTPLPGPFIFASRFISSFQVGAAIPFYDLQQGGAFESENLFGGAFGVRGVPNGRYAGRIKVVSNTEIRATLPRFRLLGQRFRLGTTTFFDFGRVWKDYHLDPIADGTKLGLKIGVGGGIFAQWGEAAIFRVEIAYSPDAVSENPGFPVGIYVADGLMF